MRLLVISLILLFIPLSNIYGEEFTWPDANDYTYPEYEINIIKHLNNGIQLSVLENKTFKFMTIKLIQQRSTLYLKRMHLVNDQKVEIAKTFC